MQTGIGLSVPLLFEPAPLSPLDANLYIVTEFVSGGNLEDRLKSSRIEVSAEGNHYVNVTCRFDVRQLMKFAVGIANGMRHLEKKKVRCVYFIRELKHTRTATPASGGKKNIYSWSSYFTKYIFTLVALYVSIFAEIPLTPASPPERNDGH